ncbi:MAG: hypothetical protein ABI675_24625 [Chitinophagaceae bacterium]
MLISLFLTSVLSCKKNNDAFTTGIVIEQNGCFTDSYLVAIDNPDFPKHPFLKSTVLASCITCYNCSNAVFVRVPSSFSASGTRIKFSYLNNEVSCLSSSESPNHIRVKNLTRL